MCSQHVNSQRYSGDGCDNETDQGGPVGVCVLIMPIQQRRGEAVHHAGAEKKNRAIKVKKQTVKKTEGREEDRSEKYKRIKVRME